MLSAPFRRRALLPSRGPGRLLLVLLLLALPPAAAPAAADPREAPPASGAGSDPADAPTPDAHDAAPDDEAGDAGGTAADAATADPPQPPLIPVPAVTVTATRGEREVLDVPGNVTVIDREAIERSGARTVPELLRREAGLFVTNTTTNPEGATVEARGFNNGGGNGARTLVLVDGRRVNEPNSSVTDWAFLPLANIERIEVVRGPASGVWGDNAIGGVIQILTRHPQEDGVRLDAEARSGAYDTDAGSVLLQGREGPVSASAFFDSYKTHGYRERSGFRRRTGELDLRYEVGEIATLGVKGGYATSLRERPGDLSKAEIEEDRRQAEPGSQEDFDTARERWVQGLLEVRPAENLKLRVVPFHRRRTDSAQSSEPTSLFALEREMDSLGLNSQMEADLDLFGRPDRLIVGLDLLQEDVDNTSLFQLLGPDGMPTFTSAADDANRRRVWGAFVQNELWITDELQLALGLRHDRANYEGTDGTEAGEFSIRHTEWSPRAALTWRFAEPVSVYASWARGFRFPNFDEASGFFGSAPMLEPETSQTYEVGLKARSECASLNLAFYTMNVENEILFNPFAPNPLTGFSGLNVNVDRVRHRGVELSASVRPADWLELFGTYTYDDVKFTRDRATGFEGNRLPLVPEHRGSAGVRLILPYGFEASVKGRYVGARPVANDLGNTTEKLPKFASYDARVAWTGDVTEWLALTLEVNGYNLTDREYAEFGGQSSFPPFATGFFPSPERHYVAGIRFTVTP